MNDWAEDMAREYLAFAATTRLTLDEAVDLLAVKFRLAEAQGASRAANEIADAFKAKMQMPLEMKPE